MAYRCAVISGATSIHAPHFFPWPLLVVRHLLSETIIYLDHLAYKNGYFQNRTKLINSNGNFWCTIPIASS